jgi:hypothetical protein
MMNLSEIKLSRPLFLPRHIVYFLFVFVILVLVVEAGYYFWIQKAKIKVLPPPSVIRQEGIFTYIKGESGVETQIWGVVEAINGNELIIRASNDDDIKIKYNNEEILMVERGVGGSLRRGEFDQLRQGDKVELYEIEEDTGGNLFSGFLLVVR